VRSVTGNVWAPPSAAVKVVDVTNSPSFEDKADHGFLQLPFCQRLRVRRVVKKATHFSPCCISPMIVIESAESRVSPC